MMRLPKDLRACIALFHSHGVEFLVVGAHALAYHGAPRYTGDLDLWVRRTPDNAARLVRALDAFGFRSLGLTAADFLAPGQVVQLGRPPQRIDVLTDISGVEFDRAWEQRREGDLDGVPVAFIGRDDFRRNKLASGRAKDAADVALLDGPQRGSREPETR